MLVTAGIKQYISEYSASGAYPVIQQGDQPVAGYSDNEPIKDYENKVIFGDHTVSLYRPGSPFLLASDGVKVLSVNDFDGDFLFAFLERFKPKSEGYKRHFTILKNQNGAFPNDSAERNKIGELFKILDSLIAANQQEKIT